LVTATTDITNYTDAHTITIYKGIGKLQISSIKLIHLINLSHLENELLQIREHTQTRLKNSYHYHTLTHEIIQPLKHLVHLRYNQKNAKPDQ